MTKKLLGIGLCICLVSVMMIATFGQAQAAEKIGPSNEPPLCYPIQFTDEGYWGMSCWDEDHNIASVNLKTNGDITQLLWDSSSAHMIVQLDGGTELTWQVCDSNKACAGGVYQ